ncbi:hypothetical protein ACFL35_11275 [Candidatus Riflebacteria bacterium]
MILKQASTSQSSLPVKIRDFHCYLELAEDDAFSEELRLQLVGEGMVCIDDIIAFPTRVEKPFAMRIKGPEDLHFSFLEDEKIKNFIVSKALKKRIQIQLMKTLLKKEIQQLKDCFTGHHLILQKFGGFDDEKKEKSSTLKVLKKSA